MATTRSTTTKSTRGRKPKLVKETTPEIETKGKKQKCVMCGKEKAYSNFYRSKAPMYKGNNGFMCYCKDCVVSEYNNFLVQTRGKETLAIKLTCCEFSINYVDSFAIGAVGEIDKIKDKVENGEEITNFSDDTTTAFHKYMKNLNSLGKFNSIDETDGFNYLANLAITKDEEVTVDIFSEKARSLQVTNEMIEFWDGVKDKRKLYILEKIWNEYADAYKMSNPVHVKLIKECAFLELDSIEKRNDNIKADVSENTKKIKELLGSLNLLPKNNKNPDGAEECDGILIKSIENKHPIDNTQWKDKENFYKCIGAIWKGQMNANLKIPDANNPYYDKVMSELNVENTPIAPLRDKEDGEEDGKST